MDGRSCGLIVMNMAAEGAGGQVEATDHVNNAQLTAAARFALADVIERGSLGIAGGWPLHVLAPTETVCLLRRWRSDPGG